MRALKIAKIFNHKKNVLWSLYFELCSLAAKPAYFPKRKYKAPRTKHKRKGQLEKYGSSINIYRLSIDPASFFRREQHSQCRDLFRRDQAILRTHLLNSIERAIG